MLQTLGRVSKVPWSKTRFCLNCTSARKHSLSPSLFSHHHHLIWQSLPRLSSSTQNDSTETQTADKLSSSTGCEYHNEEALASDSVRCSSKVRKPGPTVLSRKANLHITLSKAVSVSVIQGFFSTLTVIPKGLSESAAAEGGSTW